MSNYTVVLDACVLYPAPLRSCLLYAAQTGLFNVRWTEQINDEWVRNLLKNRPDLPHEKLQRTTQLMSDNIPDCLVEGYEPLINGIDLPDPDDRHVVAAAIRGQADAIITFNLADFPQEKLAPLGITAIHPDEFLADMFELSSAHIILAAQNQRRSYKNPAISQSDYLDMLLRQQLPSFTSKLRQYELFL